MPGSNAADIGVAPGYLNGTLPAKLHEAMEKLKEYLTTLIFAAVTGKINVREEAINGAQCCRSLRELRYPCLTKPRGLSR